MNDENATKPRRSHVFRWVFGVVALAALGAGSTYWFMGKKVWTDGGVIRVADSEARVREVMWSLPKALGSTFNTEGQEYEPSISPDGNELYFVRGKPGAGAHIYRSVRAHSIWGEAKLIESLKGPSDDLGPRVTADGRFLLFYSDRPGGLGGYDIWASSRGADGSWGTPFNLGPSVNGEFNEFSPDPTPDGTHLIFATNRKAALRAQKESWRATIRETETTDYDLWIAEADIPAAAIAANLPSTQPSTQPSEEVSASPGLASAEATPGTQPATQPSESPTSQPAAPALAFAPAYEIAGINTPYVEGASCMSPAGDFLYFSSDRPGGFGKFDIYRCRVADWRFGQVENLGPLVNSADNEADPALGMGGYRLYFSSDRPGSRGGYDLYVSDSREVFAQRTGHPLPHLGYSTWVMLLSLLVLIPLLLALRGWGEHRLSLLQKCLLLSLLFHVLITFALSFVVVMVQNPNVRQLVKKETGLDLALSLPKELQEALAIRNPLSSDLPVRSGTPAELSRSSQPGPAQAEALAAPPAINVQTPRADLPGGVKVEVAAPQVAPVNPRMAEVAVRAESPRSDQPEVHVTLPREAKPLTAAEPQQSPTASPPPLVHLEVPQPIALPQPKVLTAGTDSPTAKPAADPVAQPAPSVARAAPPDEHVAVVPPSAPNAIQPQANARVNAHAPVAEAHPDAPTAPELATPAPRRSVAEATAAAPTATELPAPPRTAIEAQGGVSQASPRAPSLKPAASADSAPQAAPEATALDAPKVAPVATAQRQRQQAEASPLAQASATEMKGIAAAPRESTTASRSPNGPGALAAGALPQSNPDVQSQAAAPAPIAPHVGGVTSAAASTESLPDATKGLALVTAPRVGVAGPARTQQKSEEASPTASASGGAAAKASPLAPTGDARPTGASEVAVQAGPTRSIAGPTTQPVQVASRTGDKAASLVAGSSASGNSPVARESGLAAVPEVQFAGPHAGSSLASSEKPLTDAASISGVPSTQPAVPQAIASTSGQGTRPSDLGQGSGANAPARLDGLPGSASEISAAAGHRSVPAASVGTPGATAAVPEAPVGTIDPVLPHIGARGTGAIARSNASDEMPPAGGSASEPGASAPVSPSRLGTGTSPSAAIAAASTSVGVPVAVAPPVADNSMAPAPVLPRIGGGPAGPQAQAGGPDGTPAALASAAEGPRIALPVQRGHPGIGQDAPPPIGTGGPSASGGERIASVSRQASGPVVKQGPGVVRVDVSATSPTGLTGGRGRGGEGFTPVASGPPGSQRGRPLLMSDDVATPAASVAPLPGSQGPGRLTAPDSPYAQRSVEQRKPLIEKLGGTKESEAAVGRALAYLARFQEPDGRWTYVADDAPAGHRARAPHDMAYTSLALLAFLAQDHAPNKTGPYREVVERGVAFLLRNQDVNGDLRGPADMRGPGSAHGNLYDQGIATLAMAEAALMTHDQRYTDAAFAGARFILSCQNPETGGWRYAPREPGDTSVFGWEIMALHSAEMLGFEIPDANRKRILKYIDYATMGKHGMLASYLPSGNPTAPMTAEMAFCRMILGQHLSDVQVKEATDFLGQEPPDLSRPDMYYWYYASLSMMQMQSRSWKVWNAYTRDGLVRMQQRGGPSDGAWRISMKRAERAGNIFTTAIGALTLEVYYRYGPLLETAGQADR